MVSRGIAIVAIAIATVLAVFFFYSEIALPGVPGVTLTISPRIYAPEANIGVLNEEANFAIHATNRLDHAVPLTILVTAGNSVVQSQQATLLPGESKDFQISQELSTTGIWTVAVTATSNMTMPIESYSFEVKTNPEEANVAINQWKYMQWNGNLAGLSLLVAALSLCISIASLRLRWRSREQQITISMTHDMFSALESERETRKLETVAETVRTLLSEHFKRKSSR